MIFKSKTFRVIIKLVLFLIVMACDKSKIETITTSSLSRIKSIPFKIIAHRGASAYMPENTRSAFKKAFELRANGIELDIWKTLNDSIMVIHDRNTFRTTGVSYEVPETNSTIIHNLIIKDEFKIPYLSDILEDVPEDGMIFFDVKTYNEKGKAGELAQDLVNFIKKNNLVDRSVIVCFSPSYLATIKKIEPKLICLFSTYKNNNDHIIKLIKDYNLDGLNIDYQGLNNELVEKARTNNMLIYTWTIDNPDIAIQIYNDYKVDGIITKTPDIIRIKAEKYYN